MASARCFFAVCITQAQHSDAQSSHWCNVTHALTTESRSAFHYSDIEFILHTHHSATQYSAKRQLVDPLRPVAPEAN